MDTCALPNSLTDINEVIFGQSNCSACFDTGVAVSDRAEVDDCARCATDGLLSPGGFMLFEKVALRRARDLVTSPDHVQLAQALTHFTAERPIGREALMRWLGYGEREIKQLIADLRKEWLLPVGSRKSQPAGYWMIRTADEFLDWHRRYRSQALTELATGYAVMRSNFPELAGQGKLDFIEQATIELHEALRG